MWYFQVCGKPKPALLNPATPNMSESVLGVVVGMLPQSIFTAQWSYCCTDGTTSFGLSAWLRACLDVRSFIHLVGVYKWAAQFMVEVTLDVQIVRPKTLSSDILFTLVVLTRRFRSNLCGFLFWVFGLTSDSGTMQKLDFQHRHCNYMSHF